mmetsp:Transcript_12734/g.15101  ORF Transcript_12734/g.15101 Transcript_12734/m.15101 type:complete len:191 (+) Transcript_12734:93-665(+)
MEDKPDFKYLGRLVSKLDGGDLKQVLHQSVDTLCGGQTGGHQLAKSTNVHHELSQYCNKAFKYAVGNDIEAKEILSMLVEAEVSEEAQKAFVSVLEGRRSEIKNSLVEAASAIFPSTLKDFDWSLKRVLASNKLAEINESVVILDLKVKNSDGYQTSTILELDALSLDKLLSKCVAANKIVRNLTHGDES